MICDTAGRRPWLISGRVPEVPQTLRRIEFNHRMDWVRACKESASSRLETASNFSEAGPFNEMVVMGVLAVRLQGLNKVLNWDGANMRFTNINDNETLKMLIKENMEHKENERMRAQKTWTDDFNARQFAERLVKTEYREGWSLPPMPA